MADWNDQDVNDLLPGEPWTSAKANAAFENPPAIAEGAAGAPRNYLGSLERLVAGDQVRATFPNVNTETSNVLFSARFVQGGTVRFVATRPNSNIEFSVNRLRGGANSVVLNDFDGNLNHDFSVIPGDVFTASASPSTPGFDGTVSSISIRTNGQDLWPAEGLFGYLVNNRALT